MLEVNNLIFPKPKRIQDLSYMDDLWEHVIYIPKNRLRPLQQSSQIKNFQRISPKQFNREDNQNNSLLFDHQLKKKNQGIFQHKRMTLPENMLQAFQNIQNNNINKQKEMISSMLKRKPAKIAIFQPIKIFNQQRKSLHGLQRTKFLTYRQNFTNKASQFDIQSNKRKNSMLLKSYSLNKKIPCLHIKSNCLKNKEKIVIYYHGNGQDIASCYQFVKLISIYMNMDALIVQYPTYSIYNSVQQIQEKQNFYFKSNIFNNSRQCTQQQIQKDSIDVVEHLVSVGYQIENVILIGRSIGTGVVINLAALYKFKAIVLLSPFTSIKATVKNMYGQLASLLLKQRFNNIQKIKYVQSPVLIIHGMKDKMIPYQHSIQLSKQLLSYCSLKLIAEMTHSSFHYEKDFLFHLDQFLKQIDQQSFEK